MHTCLGLRTGGYVCMGRGLCKYWRNFCFLFSSKIPPNSILSLFVIVSSQNSRRERKERENLETDSLSDAFKSLENPIQFFCSEENPEYSLWKQERKNSYKLIDSQICCCFGLPCFCRSPFIEKKDLFIISLCLAQFWDLNTFMRVKKEGEIKSG